MPVRAEAVAGVDGRDLLVAVVVDVVGAGGQAAEAGALPEGEDGLTAVGLGAEVGRGQALRDGMEPDDVAVAVEDLGAVGVRARVAGRGDEDVAVPLRSVRGEEGQRRRRGGSSPPSRLPARSARRRRRAKRSKRPTRAIGRAGRGQGLGMRVRACEDRPFREGGVQRHGWGPASRRTSRGGQPTRFCGKSIDLLSRNVEPAARGPSAGPGRRGVAGVRTAGVPGCRGAGVRGWRGWPGVPGLAALAGVAGGAGAGGAGGVRAGGGGGGSGGAGAGGCGGAGLAGWRVCGGAGLPDFGVGVWSQPRVTTIRATSPGEWRFTRLWHGFRHTRAKRRDEW